MKYFIVFIACLSLTGIALTQQNTIQNSQIVQTMSTATNEAYIMQSGGLTDKATIHQTGVGNWAYIGQEASGQIATGNGAWWDGKHWCTVPYGGSVHRGIVQIGSNNYGLIKQLSGSPGSEAGIGQYSNSNDAVINQMSGALNSHFIQQEGSDGNYAIHTVAGGSNKGRTRQVGDQNVATVDQFGGNNYVYQFQKGHNPYSATISQTGNNNASNCDNADGLNYTTTVGGVTTTVTSPTFSTLGPGGIEYVTQYQNGSHNTANTAVTGDWNNTVQYQKGHDNVGYIDINGNGTAGTPQLAKQVQLGNRNFAVSQISGNVNISAQYQNGGHYSFIQLMGNNNQATAIQGVGW